MKAAIVLIVFCCCVLLVSVAFAQAPPSAITAKEYAVGDEFRTKECLKTRELTCQYLKRCVKRSEENACSKYGSRQECTEWKNVDVTVEKDGCLQFETPNKYEVDRCYKCLTRGKIKTTEQQAKCFNYKTVQFCEAFSQEKLCAEYKLVKYCWEVNVPYDIDGPKSCPAGQELTFKLDKERSLIQRSCRPVQKITLSECSGLLDPHMRGVNGVAYEFQSAGDFDFLSTNDGVFDCDIRLQRYAGSWSGTTGFACRVNGEDVYQWDQFKAMINGHAAENKDGTITLPNGGTVTVASSGSLITIVAPNRAQFVFQAAHSANGVTAGHIWGKIPNDIQTDGLCSGVNIDFYEKTRASGLFNYQYKSQFTAESYPTVAVSDADKKNAELRCGDVFTKGSAPYNNCIFDLLNAPAQIQKQTLIEAEKEAVRYENSN